MERTQSCSDFKENLCNTDNQTTTNFVNIIEQQQQQQQLQTTQQLKIKSAIPADQSRATAMKSLNSSKPTLISSANAGTALRKKRLQRQKSTVYSCDEAEYAADLEEEEDDEEDEGYSPASDRDLNLSLSPASNISNQKKKQVRFRSKQQSESSLHIKGIPAAIPLDKTASSSSLTSSLTSSGTMSSSGHERRLKSDGSFDSVSELPPCSPVAHFQLHKGILKRDNSIHSDSSRYSSVDSLLEARKPDPEAILINLGFGPVVSEDILSRIPKRFLKPSQVRGIDTEAFIKRLQLAHTLADHSVLGYRGLTGNPDAPPSHIVAKIMERFEVNERKKSLTSTELKLR